MTAEAPVRMSVSNVHFSKYVPHMTDERMVYVFMQNVQAPKDEMTHEHMCENVRRYVDYLLHEDKSNTDPQRLVYIPQEIVHRPDDDDIPPRTGYDSTRYIIMYTPQDSFMSSTMESWLRLGELPKKEQEYCAVILEDKAAVPYDIADVVLPRFLLTVLCILLFTVISSWILM